MKRFVQTLVSLLLAGAILWWLYRDFPFATVTETFKHGMNWGWMLFSLLFGIFPQILRGWRWRMTLEPLGEHVSRRNCVYSIFMSFAASLIIPRIGEISRCGTLVKTDHVSFTKSLGTVVTERIVDSVLVLIILFVTFLLELPVFLRFCHSIGFEPQLFFQKFTPAGILVTLACALAAFALLLIVLRRFHLHKKFKAAFKQFWEGIVSLRNVKNLPLYLVETVAIWLCYFLHFYLAFYAFDFTSHLGPEAGLLSFCMITVAVLVPTPNGAGPWHFAVKVVLMLFGVAASDAILFALIVHALQTLLVVVLGLYGYAALFLKQHSKPVVETSKNK
jgi:uncharacterized protein (TIRG00374 family)